jgi:3-oxoacyl-[acyl-carrier protein] reductase
MSLGLVTGGSRGIGRAVVEALLADGWTVAFTYRQDERAARDVEAAAPGRARGFALDLADREGPGRLVAEIETTLGPVQALVNNAAVRAQALLAMTSDAEWGAVMDANVDGAFRCCRAVLPKMLLRRQGAIVNVSSLAAVAGIAGQTAYAASKAALLGMTRALAREVGRRGIRVNAVLPGFVATDMTASLPDDVVRALRAHECLARGTSAADVGHLVAFLVSERAAAITGQALIVDAGTSA